MILVATHRDLAGATRFAVSHEGETLAVTDRGLLALKDDSGKVIAVFNDWLYGVYDGDKEDIDLKVVGPNGNEG